MNPKTNSNTDSNQCDWAVSMFTKFINEHSLSVSQVSAWVGEERQDYLLKMAVQFRALCEQSLVSENRPDQ